MATVREWLAIARERPVVVRSLQYAVVVGAVLVAINEGSRIIADRLYPSDFVRIGLTVVVPYLVSTFSSVAAIRDFRQTVARSAGADDPG